MRASCLEEVCVFEEIASHYVPRCPLLGRYVEMNGSDTGTAKLSQMPNSDVTTTRVFVSRAGLGHSFLNGI